jgi:hypothetical protein
MKRHILIAAASLGILFNAKAASPLEEARFLAEVTRAFEQKDAQAFLNLFCWDRVPPFIKSVSEKTASGTVGLKVDTINLVAASPEIAKTEFTRDGITYRPNLPVTKQIEVAHSYSGGNGKVTLPVGEKDGKLFITTAAPSK